MNTTLLCSAIVGIAGLIACTNLPVPNIDAASLLASNQQSQTETHHEESESSRTVEEINGKSIDDDEEDGDKKERRASKRDRDDDDDEDDRPRKKRKKNRDRDDDEDEDDEPRARKTEPEKLGFGATCKTNNDCESRACYVGSGELGYCTKMCDSWSDCPSFWECKKPGNAPQRICMQDED